MTTKSPATTRQKENLATTVLPNKVTTQQIVSHSTQTSESPINTVLLASSRRTVTVPAVKRHTTTLNTKTRPWVVNRSTSHISASRNIDSQDIFNRTQSRKETYEPTSSKEGTANGILPFTLVNLF